MYNDLLKINMILTQFNVDKKIVIDNKDNRIIYDNKSRVETKENLVLFLDIFFRVLRTRIANPQKIEPFTNKGYLLKIKIVEKENEFDYVIKGNCLDELDEFYDVLNWIRK